MVTASPSLKSRRPASVIMQSTVVMCGLIRRQPYKEVSHLSFRRILKATIRRRMLRSQRAFLVDFYREAWASCPMSKIKPKVLQMQLHWKNLKQSWKRKNNIRSPKFSHSHRMRRSIWWWVSFSEQLPSNTVAMWTRRKMKVLKHKHTSTRCRSSMTQLCRSMDLRQREWTGKKMGSIIKII